jgi:hypothetical protein
VGNDYIVKRMSTKEGKELILEIVIRLVFTLVGYSRERKTPHYGQLLLQRCPRNYNFIRLHEY